MSASEDARLGHGHAGRVDVDFEGSVAVVTLRNGEENRFNMTTVQRINEALDKVLSNPNAHALVMRGEGKFFSAGLDLPWIQYQGQHDKFNDVMTFLANFMKIIARVLTFPLPTVALINGHAAAGGALFALAFDKRVMRKDRGFYYINEVRIGMHITGLLKEIAIAKIPQGDAFIESVILGKKLTGPDTLQLGITTAVYEERELLQGGIDTAKQCLSQGPLNRETLQKNKEGMYAHVLTAAEDKNNAGKRTPEYFMKALAQAKM